MVMSKSHRYTGEWPPIEVLRQYPNWEYALDEEGDEGQDETTIRPEPEQRHITSQTAFTTGTATQADGTRRRALLGITFGQVESVDVFVDDKNCWTLIRMPSGWCQSWLPEEKRMLSISLTDPNIFPLHVISDLSDATGNPLDLKIEA
jgi:hypothetical protein